VRFGCICGVPVGIGGALCSGVPHEIDPVKAEDRLLWLEGRGLALAQEARRIRRRLRGRPWIDEAEVLGDVARLQRELVAREDEARIWRRYLSWWRGWWPW
jgi:hypothetical protein